MFRIEKTHSRKTFKVVLSCQHAPPPPRARARTHFFLKKRLLRTPEKLQRVGALTKLCFLKKGARAHLVFSTKSMVRTP